MSRVYIDEECKMCTSYGKWISSKNLNIDLNAQINLTPEEIELDTLVYEKDGSKYYFSDAVIQFGNGLEIFGEGAWLFFLVKATIVGLIVWMFTEMRVESRQQHLRVLIVLGVMIVGLAPGLRDIGRLILGV